MKTLARMASKAPYHVSEEGAQGGRAYRNRVVPSRDFSVSYVMLLAFGLRLLEPDTLWGGEGAGDPPKTPRGTIKTIYFISESSVGCYS